MKKFLFNGFGVMTLVAACLTLASCDDKDEDEAGLGTNGDVTLINNTRLLKVGRIDFGYDSSGRLSTLGEYGETYAVIDYSKGQIWTDGECTDIKFNSDGYISEMKGSGKEVDEEGEVLYNASNSYSYDSNGHIVKRIDSIKSTSNSYSSEETSTIIYHWTGDILTHIEYENNYFGIDDEQNKFEETHKSVTTFAYGDINNTSRQYSVAMGRAVVMGEETGLLSMVGLFGKGPAKLPVTISETYSISYSDGYGYSGEECPITLEYTLNADGTIATERIIREDDEDYTHVYTYGTPSKSGSNIAPMKTTRKEARKALRHRLARRR